MDRWAGRVALVTGASSGIGKAICKKLVEAGMIVVGAARRVERIQDLAKELESQPGTLFGVECDLTKDDDIYNLFSVIKDKYKGVDVCINNAGILGNQNLLDGTPEEWRQVTNVNVIALCLCTKLSVKSMQERKVDDGHIIHLSSIAAYKILDDLTATNFYCSTKHAVRALTEGLRCELRDLKSNIRVSSISPGIVKTDIHAGVRGEAAAEELFEREPFIESEEVADTLLHMLAVPPHVQLHEVIIKPVREKW